MPLSCDCYGGCWAAHSESWIKIGVGDPERAQTYWKVAQKVLPHGSYVYMETELRVETQEGVDRIFRTVNDEREITFISFDAAVTVNYPLRGHTFEEHARVCLAVERDGSLRLASADLQ